VRRLKSAAALARTRVAPYLGVALVATVSAVYLLHLRHADLRIPFEYRRDALLYGSVIKSVLDHGWFWRNPSLGAPAGLQLYDYPNVAHEALHLLAIKGLSIFTRDWALLLNVYFLLGFPLIAVAAMAALRQLGVRPGAAAVGGVLYAFLPTRLLKGEGHIFLDTFWQVPLAVVMLVWVCSDAPPLLWWPSGRRSPDERRCRQRGVAALVICGVSVVTSAYYSFFTICLALAAGLWASIERRSARNLVAAVGLAATLVAGMAVVGLPAIVYQRRHGPNFEVGRRAAAEAELYGMKVTQLLLPADGHRIGVLRQLKQRYNASAPFSGENSTTSLGLVGSVGFIALLGALFVRRRHSPANGDWFSSLAKLCLAAVLLGTIGGFGSLFAYLVDPQIRTYSRIAVFVGFFALAAVAGWLDQLARRRPRTGAIALVGVLAFGLLDQVTPLASPSSAEPRQRFLSDRDLIRAVEARLSPGTMLFQLPYVPFPEGLPVHDLEANDLLRPYLHARTLRWGTPTMRGRSGDQFARQLAERAPAEILATLAATGFGGVVVHRDGYADQGAAIEAAFHAALGAAPLVSADHRLMFFDLTHYPAAPALTPAEIDRVLRPIVVGFSSGFHAPEAGPSGPFRWCDATGEIDVDNDSAATQRVSVRATLAAARPPARLIVAGDLASANLDLGEPVEFTRVLEVSPGHHVLRLTSDGRPAEAPNDPRRMVWRLENFAFDELPPSSAVH